MTSETKRFIELSDIIGLRLKCSSCECSLLLDTQKEGGPIDNLMASNNATLSKCPTCGEGWTQFRERGEPWDSDIKDLLRKLRLLKRVEKNFGCSLSLEIKEEKKP